MKLAIFFLVALLVHGPLSPFLPTAFETALLYYGRLYSPWVLAIVGTAGASLAEIVNYRLVDWAAELPKLTALKSRKTVRWSIAAFLRAPFWTTVLVIFSPIPDSAVRILAPIAKYPLPRFLLAVALGRFPRLLLIAGLGVVMPIPNWLLMLIGVGLVGFGFIRPHVSKVVEWLKGAWRRPHSPRRKVAAWSASENSGG